MVRGEHNCTVSLHTYYNCGMIHLQGRLKCNHIRWGVGGMVQVFTDDKTTLGLFKVALGKGNSEYKYN